MSLIRTRKNNGQFRKTTVEDIGVSQSLIADGGIRKCVHCGAASRPIMKNFTCGLCGQKQESK